MTSLHAVEGKKTVGDTEYVDQRGELVQSLERDEQELRLAVRELTGAARLKLDLSERIKEFPLTWVIGSFLLGLWLGSRAAPTACGVEGQR